MTIAPERTVTGQGSLEEALRLPREPLPSKLHERGTRKIIKVVIEMEMATDDPLSALVGHTGPVYSVAFSPDGETLVSGSADNTVRLWRVADGALLCTLKDAEPVSSVAFSPDGLILASGSWNKVRLWQAADGALLHTLEGHTGWVTSVAFSPGGQTLASGATDNTARLWQVVDGTLLYTLEGHTNQVTSVAFSPDGQILASGSWDDTVRLWWVTNGTLLRILKGHTGSVEGVAFSPNGQILASVSVDCSVWLWRVASDTRPCTIRLKQLVPSEDHFVQPRQGEPGSVLSVAFSPDEQHALALGTWNGAVWLWGTQDAPLRILAGHTGPVFSVAFSPDGKTLASGGGDHTVRLWKLDCFAPSPAKSEGE